MLFIFVLHSCWQTCIEMYLLRNLHFITSLLTGLLQQPEPAQFKNEIQYKKHWCYCWFYFLCVVYQAFETKKGSRSPRNSNTVIYSFAGKRQKNRCSTFRVRRSQTIYWKEGLLVTFDGGYLRSDSIELSRTFKHYDDKII